MTENHQIIKNKPQIKAPRVTPLEGVSAYAPQGIRVRGVENPQGFGIDKRRYGLDLLSLGDGMLATEALRNEPGLTPLRFDFDNRIGNLKIGSLGEEFLATEGTESAEKRRRLSGISVPLSLRGNLRKEGEI
ncbi:Uncharacterised protein [uncultured archaeon]|nr:Uncharacterised protein [uncultured archaeon]